MADEQLNLFEDLEDPGLSRGPAKGSAGSPCSPNPPCPPCPPDACDRIDPPCPPDHPGKGGSDDV